MLKYFAEKRAKELYSKYPSILMTEKNAFEIVEKIYEKYNEKCWII